MSKQTQYPKFEILGVEVDALTINQAVDYIVSSARKSSFYVTKPYVEFLDRASQDRPTQELLDNSELCLADGVSLCWAAHFLYGGKRSLSRLIGSLFQILLQPGRINSVLPQRFAGTTFTWALLERCAKDGLSVYLIGSPYGRTIEQTRATINKRLPKLQIVGTSHGLIDGLQGQKLYDALEQGNPATALLTQIKTVKPDIILVGMGFPLQERLMAKLAQELENGALIGEGGTFDYREFGGHIVRAPGWLRRLGLEWLWRLARQPGARIGRQLAIPRFIMKVWQSR